MPIAGYVLRIPGERLPLVMSLRDRMTEVVERIMRLLEQQIYVVGAVNLGSITEHDLAAYHACDLEIRCLFEELEGKSHRVRLAS